MANRSLERALRDADDAVSFLRDLGVGKFTKVPDEYTNWIEEQRAWRESCALANQSYHMTDLELEGPDAIELYSDLAVNDFSGFRVGRAKQLVLANPNGYFIGDAVLFRLGDEEFLSVGAAAAHHWLRYHAETDEYDVAAEMRGRPVATGDDPEYFRFQLQGPDAEAVMEEVVDRPLPEIPFFNFEETSIDGHEVRVLRHGMAGERGYEFWGSYENDDEIERVVLDAGEEYGIRRLGSKSYQSANTVLGWIPLPVPAIYTGEEMRPFREWLDARRGILSIGGSFDSGDITDYYVTPVEMGYDHIVDFDHDFVGKAALREEMADPDRKKVTLVWNDEDVIDVYGSLFEEGSTNKYMDLPVPRTSACQYDEVRVDGDLVGVSKWMSYLYNHREMLSLAILDVEYADPGTEVTLIWGEAGGAANPRVERHDRKKIGATVAPAPYGSDRR